MNKYNLLPLVIIVVGLGISAALAFGNRSSVDSANSTVEFSVDDTSAENLRRVDLEIKGMFCLGCRGSVIGSVTALPGVLQADADPSTDSGWVVYDSALISKEQIANTPIFEVYPARILNDQPYKKNTTQTKEAIEIPDEIVKKLNQLAELLKERDVTLEPFFREELDTAIKQGYFDKADSLLNNFLKVYEQN